MKELQDFITEENTYRENIENMHVELQFLNIRIKELDDGVEYLQGKKEDLDEAKKATDEQNEDLEKQLKAKEEANQKRLIAKLQRDKNPDIKDLIVKEETQQELNDDFGNKCREETDKHSELLDKLIEIREELRLKKLLFEETKFSNDQTDAQLAELKTVNDTKQADVNARVKRVEEARKTNLFEEERNRKLNKIHAAHKAKLNFIEESYDYTSQAKAMSVNDFRELMESNTNFNASMGPFTGKLDGIKKEIQTLEAMKSMQV